MIQKIKGKKSPAVANIQLLTYLTESHMIMKSYVNEPGFPHSELSNRNKICLISALGRGEKYNRNTFKKIHCVSACTELGVNYPTVCTSWSVSDKMSQILSIMSEKSVSSLGNSRR